MIVFRRCPFQDLVALVDQTIVGASASQATHQHKNVGAGGHIVLGGIVFQLVYFACAIEFFWRFYHTPVRKVSPTEVQLSSLDKFSRAIAIDKNIRLMVLGLALSSITIFIRSVYRTVELADGWAGHIIGTQVYFNFLDGGTITIVMYTLNSFHPGRLLTPLPSSTYTPDEKKDKIASIDSVV
ncbi:hypothetical protein JAAARDRAFT_200957 [Jaapia argillacea MUCL 33604]|uniref:Uncharacterized protein n=1 Tax=Jaapia argillacea MUCL 33604 TaxID=933084 RepID=A0A067PE78_9AGAM|nr:hypothetical protein JAAARDRAFT_200957 [Jaapia argillacea MUCL 33604]